MPKNHYDGLITYQEAIAKGGIAPIFDMPELENKSAFFESSYSSQWFEGFKGPFRVTIFGLGDVGGTMATVLRAIGSDQISALHIYDLNPLMVARYVLELNQMYCEAVKPIPVYGATKENLYDTDVLIFTASKSVPPVGAEVKDMRMVQLEANSQIVKAMVKDSFEAGFKGLYAIVSDPVDLLCQVARDTLRVLEGDRAVSLRVKGFGLGVMYARARYFAGMENHQEFYDNGRVYGPHGKDLVVLNAVGEDYDQQVSEKLKKLTVEANLAVRELGFKPYLAPAVSSGVYAIKAFLEGHWHHATICFGNQYLGIRNKWTPDGIEIETIPYQEAVAQWLKSTLLAMEADYAVLPPL